VDDNYDGVFETKNYFKNGVLNRVEIDLNNDKNPNVVENYIDGVIYDSGYYRELTHKIWKKVLYENGIISQEYIDQDSKGTFDIMMNTTNMDVL
jgi:cyclophilin family peptidyl-prolyl cis-trans isomerase